MSSDDSRIGEHCMFCRNNTEMSNRTIRRLARTIKQLEEAMSAALDSLNGRIDQLTAVSTAVEQKVTDLEAAAGGVPEADVQAASDRLQPVIDGLTVAAAPVA